MEDGGLRNESFLQKLGKMAGWALVEPNEEEQESELMWKPESDDR